MTHETQKTRYVKRLISQALKWPLILMTIGLSLMGLSYSDGVFLSLNKWHSVFDLTDRIGDILFSIAIVSFIYSIVVLACRKYEKTLLTTSPVLSLILSSMRKGLRIIFVLVVINIIVSYIGPDKVPMIVANRLINLIIIASIGWIAIQVLYTTETVLYKRMQTLTQDAHVRVKSLYTKMHILRNIATVLIIIITIATMLMSFNSVRNVGISLLASAGFLTAIIGLAAQRTLVSLFAGFQIAISQPIRMGDTVVIENETGVVEHITLTYVTLKLGGCRRLVLPISFFIEKKFENWSQESDSLRSSLYLHVDYLMPIEPLRKELDNILAASRYWDKSSKSLQVSDITERSVQIKIQVSASNTDNLNDLRAEVREKMLTFIQKNYPTHFPNLRMLSSLKD